MPESGGGAPRHEHGGDHPERDDALPRHPHREERQPPQVHRADEEKVQGAGRPDIHAQRSQRDHGEGPLRGTPGAGLSFAYAVNL